MNRDYQRLVKRQARIIDVLDKKSRAKHTIVSNVENLQKLLSGLEDDIRYLQDEFNANKAELLNLHLEGEDQ